MVNKILSYHQESSILLAEESSFNTQYEGGAATPTTCAPRTHHTPSVAQITILGALSGPLMLPPDYPMNSHCCSASKRAQQFRHHTGGHSSLVRWYKREQRPGYHIEEVSWVPTQIYR